MRLTGYYPVIQVGDVAGVAAFYRRHFGFVPAFENDWFIHLKSETDARVELAILAEGHETVPPSGRGATKGLLLSFEVADARAVHAEFVAAGIQMQQELRDEAFGQRHFIVADPAGTLCDIIEPIAPSAEYLADYGPGGDTA